MIETVTFGDVVLSDFGRVIDVRRTPAGIQPSLEEVSGRDGSVLKGVRLSQPEVSFLLLTRNVSYTQRRMLVRTLSPLLLVQEVQPLAFESDEGLYYRAMLSERPDFSEYVNAGTMRMKFWVDGVAMYGRTMTAQMTGTTTIKVRGTYPTPLRISGTATPSNGYLSVRLDDRDQLSVPLSGTSSVDIDSGARTCKVAGVTSQITLDSDWLVLDAGEHTLRYNAGSGTLTLEWTERWL